MAESVVFPAPTRLFSPLDINACVQNALKSIDVDALFGDNNRDDRPSLHVEVRLDETSRIRSDTIAKLLRQYLEANYATLTQESTVDEWREIKVLSDNVDQVRIAECVDQSVCDGATVRLDRVALAIHVYRTTRGFAEEFTAASSQTSLEDAATDGDDVMAASVCELPSQTLEGVWESLIYEGDVKRRLMNYIAATMEFSDNDVSFNIISWHRLVLLHGPPGTGKTSLCRALAQKLAIRLSDRYTTGKLVEINAHSLFSKWFSESGKLVQRLFSRVAELCEDEDAFVTVLIDEVESLTAARAGAMSGKEPSDALRVVNALLTQLDKLKMRKNVLVLTTSNLSAAIDTAFIDRADVKLFIPNPPVQAAYAILSSCLGELCAKGLVEPCVPLDWRAVEVVRVTGGAPKGNDAQASLKLRLLADQCKGMSGRTLRRLPVLAHARSVMLLGRKSRRDATAWITAMSAVVEQEVTERDLVDGTSTL